MKAIEITIILSGLFFILLSIFTEPDSTSTTAGWAVWVGVLVFISGCVAYFVPRSEE